jgi:hypothetical protein
VAFLPRAQTEYSASIAKMVLAGKVHSDKRIRETSMLRIAIAAALLATPLAAAETKEQSCRYQADVVAAIQQARLDKVKERDVVEAVAETSPTWPENYNAAIPLITPWVYEQKMRDVRKKDLGAAWLELCLQQ